MHGIFQWLLQAYRPLGLRGQLLDGTSHLASWRAASPPPTQLMKCPQQRPRFSSRLVNLLHPRSYRA